MGLKRGIIRPTEKMAASDILPNCRGCRVIVDNNIVEDFRKFQHNQSQPAKQGSSLAILPVTEGLQEIGCHEIEFKPRPINEGMMYDDISEISELTDNENRPNCSTECPEPITEVNGFDTELPSGEPMADFAIESRDGNGFEPVS